MTWPEASSRAKSLWQVPGVLMTFAEWRRHPNGEDGLACVGIWRAAKVPGGPTPKFTFGTGASWESAFETGLQHVIAKEISKGGSL